MRKLKLLFTMLALIGASPVFAQTEDVTDDYLVNPSFETLKATNGTDNIEVKTKLTNGLYGWIVAEMSDYQLESEASGSVTGFPVSGDNRKITPTDGDYYYFNRKGWGNLNSTLETTTKKDVATGKYYLEFDYKAADYSNNNNAGNNGTTIGLTVIDASSNTLANVPAVKRAYSVTNNSSNPGSDAYMNTAPWTKLGIYFEVKDASTLTFKIQQNMVNSGRSDIVYDNFKLYKINGATNLDLTGLIANPSFETGNNNAWEANKGKDTGAKKNDGDYAITNCDGNYIFNTWSDNANITFNVKQSLSGLPFGKYTLSGVFGNDNKEITIKAGGTSNTVTPDDKSTGVVGSVNFDYAGGSIDIEATSSEWFKADNFKLTFLREFTPSELAAAAKVTLKQEIEKANAIDKTTNVGDKAFQIPSSAVTKLNNAISDAQGVYDNEAATVTEVEKATKDLLDAETDYDKTELIAPAESDSYSLFLSDATDELKKTVTFKSGNETQGTYTAGYTDEAGSAYNQAIHFEQSTGNEYYLYIIDAAGTKYYVCTSATAWNDGTRTDRIRMTTDKEKALIIEVIATSEEGIYNLYNTEAKALIGSNGDTGFYTASKYKAFNINAATKATVTINTKATGWGTIMLPFAAAIPEGLTAYTCDAVNGTVLTLSSPVDAFAANTPYIIEGSVENEQLSGYGVAKDATYKEGWLTGVYAEIDAPVGSYVLQNLDGVVGFYKVAEGENKQPKVGANHAYLTVQTAGGETAREAYFFSGEATGIMAIDALTSGNATIFNAAGAQIPALQKGMNIVRKADGKSYKVIVK